MLKKSWFDSANRMMSYRRDNGDCAICGDAGSDSDHVFGRGDRLKGHWMLRMTLCRGCHHQKHHGSGFYKVGQVRLLKEVNGAFWSDDDLYCTAYNMFIPEIVNNLKNYEEEASEFINDWLNKNG